MAITQLSAFVENQPGRFMRITDILDKSAVSIRGFSLADTADFGIVRLIVDEPVKAEQVLSAAGVLVKTADVLCIELPDKPGALDHVFAAVADAGINVEYAYSLVSTYVAIKVADINQAEQLLSVQPVRLASQTDLQRPFN